MTLKDYKTMNSIIGNMAKFRVKDSILPEFGGP